VAVIAIAVGSFFVLHSGSDDQPSSSQPSTNVPAPTGTGQQLSGAQARAALPPATVLGDAWQVNPRKTLNLTANLTVINPTTKPAACGKILDAIPPSGLFGAPAVAVSTSLVSPTLRQFAAVAVIGYPHALPSSAISAAKGLLPGCATYTAESKASITSVTFPRYGDGAVEIKSTVSLVGGAVHVDQLDIRVGHNVVVAEVVSGAELDGSAVKTLAQATLQRLAH
jgi:hypothetical protein